MADIIDEVVSDGPAPKQNTSFAGRRTVVNEEVGTDGRVIPGKRSAAGIEDDEISASGSGRGQRPMKESTLKLLDKLEQPDPDDEEEAPEKAPVVEAKTEDEAPAAEVDDLRVEFERVASANRELLERVEQLEAAPKRSEPSAREKMLAEAENTYLDDSVGAIRKLVASVLGVEPDHKDVDAELKILYADLTSHEIAVPLEATHKAARDAARARQMLARDKRERKAESEQQQTRATSDDDTRKADSAAAYITNRLPSLKGESGTAFADEFPLLMGLSEELDGMPPAKLLWKALEREHKAGTLDYTKLGEEKALRAVARMIEDHYEGIGKRFAGTKIFQTDTAKRAEAPSTDRQANSTRPNTAARTITNARSSVAPATPPAKKPAAPAADERPKFRNKREEQDWALRHLPD